MRMLLKPFLTLLFWLGLRRRAVVFDYCNWVEIDWRAVFKGSRWLRLLYQTRIITWPELLFSVPEPYVEGVDGGNYAHLSYRGFRLWELSKTGILASLETTRIDVFDARTRDVVAFYYRHVARLIDAADRLFDRARPDTIIVSQGCTPMTRPIVEVARTRGINIVATEGSFLQNYVFLDNATGMIVNRHGLSRLVGDWLEARDFPPADRARFRSLLARESRMKRAEHRTDAAEMRSAKEALGIPKDKKIAIFLGQVLTDASQLADSPHFTDPIELISEVVRFFRKKEDWFVVIRLHPKESDGASWANDPGVFGKMPHAPAAPIYYRDVTLKRLQSAGIRQSLRGRIAIVSGRALDTQALMQEADIGITVNSQAGFEMALKHKRVVVCGDAFYARKGFTYDVSHPATLGTVLESACRDPRLNETEARKVDQFGDYAVNHFLFPRTFAGHWGRFLAMLDGGCGSPLREWLLSRAITSLERANAGAEVPNPPTEIRTRKAA